MNDLHEKDIVKESFDVYLNENSISKLSRKNYRSDLLFFSNWLTIVAESWGAAPENLTELIPFINNSTGDFYKRHLSSWSNSISTANRKLATLRHFSKFLYKEQVLHFDFASDLKNIVRERNESERILGSFEKYLEDGGSTKNTIKNYLADIRQFSGWKKDFVNATKKDIVAYQKHLETSLSSSTIKRKVSSLRRFFDWAKNQGITQTHPIPSFPDIKNKNVKTILIPSQPQIVISKSGPAYLEIIKYPIMAASLVLLLFAISQIIGLVNLSFSNKKGANILQEEVKGTSTASEGRIIDELKREIEGLPDLIASNIVKGVLKTGEVVFDGTIYITDTINSGVLETGRLTANLIFSPRIRTNIISPLADGNVEIQIGNSSTQNPGELAIRNEFGEKIASVDSRGNANFEGEITTDKLIVEDLIATNIQSKDIVTLNHIEELLREVEDDQKLLNEATFWKTTSETLSVKDLFVTENAVVNNLSVSKYIGLGSDLVISSETDGSGFVNSINTLSSPLLIQPLALASIEAMGGLFVIDTGGNVQILGNLLVKGEINSTGLTISGDATVNSLVIAGKVDGDSTSLDGEVISASSSAGRATIPSNAPEVRINNDKIKKDSLIYVSPFSSTPLNNVLYVRSKDSCEGATDPCTPHFTVGFSDPLAQEVEFNWWILQTK